MSESKKSHSHFRRYLIAGLLVWLPIWVTLLVIKFIVDVLDGTLKLLPNNYQPDNLLGMHIPGLGLLLSLLIVFFTGMLVTNIIGRHLVRYWETIVSKIPLVRTIYISVKQVLDTLFSSQGKSFRQVLLVEYPRKEIWSLAFLTGDVSDIISQHSTLGEELLTVFIPTTPNPTSGFLLMVPTSQVKELDISVDEALKMIISLGVVQPAGPQIVKEISAQ